MWETYMEIPDCEKQDVKVAVIDTGADIDNPEIEDCLIFNDDNVSDDVGHGTKNIGIICASQYKGTVEETSGDEVVMNVVEDNIENEFIVTADGKMFVDGNEIKFDDDSNIEDAYSEEDVMMLNTGGWSWSTSKPSKIKSYANLNKLNWSCRSVTFSTAIKGITTTVIIVALTKKCPDAGLGMGCVSAIVSAFKSSDPYSKGLSYKVYIGTAVSPKSSRYCKSGTIYYSKTGYKGISKTKYLYGTMI